MSLLTWGLDKVMKDKYRKEIKSHQSRWTVNRKSMKLLLNKSITIIDLIMRTKWEILQIECHGIQTKNVENSEIYA